MTAAPGPWEQSAAEEQADLNALEQALAMSAEQRQTALAVINSRRRQAAYSEGTRYQPLAIPDGWAPPRWQQADDVTGGSGHPLIDRLPSGSVLSTVASGSVLSPLPKRDRSSRARCPRCGGWIGAKSMVVGPNGLIYCGVCCGGTRPITSGAAA